MNISDLIYEFSEDYSDDFTEEYFNQFSSSENIIKNETSTRSNKPLQIKNVKKIDSYKIYNRITKKIIGQDEQIKTIISVLIRNNMTTNPYFKSNIFLIGGTGNGKSETIKQIAKELGIPYVLEDATVYTQEGYVGDSVKNAVTKLIDEANGDIRKAEHGIVIFDEIDKKTDNGDKSGVSTTSVQDSLLKMLEGTKVLTIRGEINTELITFVLIGACENVYEERRKRLSGKGKIGFNKESKENDELKNPNFIPQDLINSGFKSEFVGREDLIIEFNPMNEDMAAEIINKSSISIFNIYIQELKKINVEVVMNRKEIVSEIAKRAIKLRTGARGIRQIVVDMFSKIYSEITVSNIQVLDGYECHITKETVYDNSKFDLCKKKRQN